MLEIVAQPLPGTRLFNELGLESEKPNAIAACPAPIEELAVVTVVLVPVATCTAAVALMPRKQETTKVRWLLVDMSGAVNLTSSPLDRFDAPVPTHTSLTCVWAAVTRDHVTPSPVRAVPWSLVVV